MYNKIMFRHDCSHMCYSKCKEHHPPYIVKLDVIIAFLQKALQLFFCFLLSSYTLYLMYQKFIMFHKKYCRRCIKEKDNVAYAF